MSKMSKTDTRSKQAQDSAKSFKENKIVLKIMGSLMIEAGNALRKAEPRFSRYSERIHQSRLAD